MYFLPKSNVVAYQKCQISGTSGERRKMEKTVRWKLEDELKFGLNTTTNPEPENHEGPSSSTVIFVKAVNS